MVNKERWDKKFNLYKENKSWVNEMFNERDKNIYPNEGDYALFIFRNFYKKLSMDSLIPDETISHEDQKIKEILNDICPWGFLFIVGNKLVCLREMRSKNKPYWFKDESGKHLLSLDEVRDFCDGCKKGEIYDRDLINVRTMFIEVAKEEGNKIYPYQMYLCNHPDVDSWRFTFLKWVN